MKRLLATLALALASSSWGSIHILVIQGAAGEEIFADSFSEASQQWLDLAKEAGAAATKIDETTAGDSAKQAIQAWLADPVLMAAESIWIVYLGHGSYGAGEAKLNLPGPDLSATELGRWLEGKSNDLVFVHGGSASSPFIQALAGPNRVIITATRSSSELNYARFGESFAQAIADPQSDIDLDGSVSLLEAFVSASNNVEKFYLEAGRLSTEHALLEDNGDAIGTPATRFQGLRPKPDSPLKSDDGRLARRLSLARNNDFHDLEPTQIEERKRLEQELESLYLKKGDMSESLYYEVLEGILNELSSIYLDPADS